MKMIVLNSCQLSFDEIILEKLVLLELPNLINKFSETILKKIKIKDNRTMFIGNISNKQASKNFKKVSIVKMMKVFFCSKVARLIDFIT
jgi:hypothetical protein